MNDSPSSGERTGTSPNHLCYGICGVVGPRCGKNLGKWNTLEKVIIEGENPVHDFLTKPSGILSSAEHEKFCVN